MKRRQSDILGAACVESGGNDLSATDPEIPVQVFFYLARATNACGDGSSGKDSSDDERNVRTCP